MSMLLQLQSIEKHYGGKVILHDAAVTIHAKQKIGVIGRNGSGKSTLLRIISGEEEADAGEIVRGEDTRIGYLTQQIPFEPGESVIAFLQRQSGLEEWRCGKTAGRFELKGPLLAEPIENLSGGYQMRVRLAALLLTDPNLLLLDEPTNYLDLNTLLLLEDFLTRYTGTFLVVSHDREFLLKTCSQTLELENGELFLFPGALEDYLEFKEERQAEQIRQNRNIEARRKELETFIERFRAKASKASQARSKSKQLDRLQKIEIGHRQRRVRIPIPSGAPLRKGNALHAAGLEIGYGAKAVARGIDLDLRRGARVAILGENGAGKSTLLKTLAGMIAPLGGEFRWGEDRVAYYAQQVYAEIAGDIDIYGYLESRAADDVTRQEILDLAGAFLFGGSDVQSSVSTLSGGERARLYLASLLLGKVPVLLLDEPTNHLDFETVEALGTALAEYPATVFFVSHDRTFVNLLATDILEIADGAATLFPGSYEDYVYRLQLRLRNSVAGSGTESGSASSASPTGDDEKGGPKKAYHLRKEIRAELVRKRREGQELERSLERHEREKNELLEYLTAHPDEYSRERSECLAELTDLLARDEKAWFNLQSEMEELEAAAREL